MNGEEYRVLKLQKPPYRILVTYEQAKYIIPYVIAKDKGTFPKPPAEHPRWKPFAVADRVWWELPKATVEEAREPRNLRIVAEILEKAKPWTEKWEKEWERKEKESKMFAKTLASRLMYPFEKERARRAGFESIEAYEKWREKAEREKNKFFMDFYVGEWDQQNLENAVKEALENPAVMPKACPDAIAFALMEYGYDFSDRKHHAGYQFVEEDPWTGKSFYILHPHPARPLWAVKNIPPEERDFPSHNYGVDRKIVESVLKRRGWVFGKHGWEKL